MTVAEAPEVTSQTASRPRLRGGKGPGHRVGEPLVVRRVVVVRKTTSIEQLAVRPDRKLERALAAHDPLAEKVRIAHEEHVRTAGVVEAVLRASGVEFQVVPRFDRRLAAWADLVVTVGGDGTFLRASHCIDAGPRGDGAPMLGVNSATSSSVGHFCAARGDDFAEVLERARAGELRSRGLWRMAILVNGRRLPDLALNDVLLAHRSPAETSRYVLRVGDQGQEQKSSGIWIATAAGSTAAIRSAGGEVIDIEARTLQYRVRELMHWLVRGEPLLGGRLDRLDVVSRMSTGMLYVDGGHRQVPLGFADRVEMRSTDRPLPWIPPAGLAGGR